MKGIAAVSRVKVSADGHGVVSHAGVGMLREVADLTGLSAQVNAVLADTYGGPWTHAPGAVFADLAAAVAGRTASMGSDNAAGIVSMPSVPPPRRPRCGGWSMTRSMPPICPGSGRPAPMPGQKAWAAGAAPDPGDWLHVDIDATITIDHSDRKEQAAPTWKNSLN